MPSPLLVSLPAETLEQAVRALPGAPLPEEVEFLRWDLSGPAPVPAIDIVVPGYQDVRRRLAQLATVRTRLVQSQSIGYDGIAEVLPPGHLFANAATVHETSTAELALALMLAAQRGIPEFVRAADAGRWAPRTAASLADRTVLLLGYGGVNKAVEARLAGFEIARVIRVATRAREEGELHVHGLDELPELLPQAEVVVVGVPLTEATTGLVSAELLAALPDGALLVNVSRGQVADTEAILAETASGRLRFALDVTDPEPLPEGHPLFSAPNVLISPHVGGATSALTPRMARLVRRQIERMLAGQEPENVVIRS